MIRLVGYALSDFLVTNGAARGEFTAADRAGAGRARFDATARFHNPAHASEWSDPGLGAAFEGVWTLILRRLAPAPTQRRQGDPS